MKRTALSSSGKKKAKKSRSEAYAANVKHFGPEPEYDGLPMGMAQKARCLAWYAAMCDVGDAREYADEYLASRSPDVAGGLKSVSDTSFPLTASWLARMADMGAHTEQGTHDFIMRSFRDAVRKYAGRSEEKIDPEFVSVA